MPDLQLVPPHRCAACGDNGWVPIEGGRVKRCECAQRRIAEQRMTTAQVPERYRGCTIGNFQMLDGPHQRSQGTALLAVGQFVETVRANRASQGVLIIGPVGVGKTHLAAAALNELQTTAKHLRHLFRDYRELLADIRNSYSREVGVTETALLAPVFEADVLVLDELGSERGTDWVLDTVSRILNTRYNRCKATILTTNFPDLPPSDMDGEGYAFRGRRSRAESLADRITEPMRSRLHEMCQVIELHGEDFRSRRRPDGQQATVRSPRPSTDPALFDVTRKSEQRGGDRR